MPDVRESRETPRPAGAAGGPVAVVWEQFRAAAAEWFSRLRKHYRLQHADAQEVLQQVGLEVHKRLRDGQGGPQPAQERAWLAKVFRSKALDLLRRRDRHTAQPLGDVLGSEREPAAREDDPAAQEERDGLWRRLWEAAERLAWEGYLNALVFIMRRLEGKTTKEVATALELTPEQVWDRLRRGARKVCAAAGIDAGPGPRTSSSSRGAEPRGRWRRGRTAARRLAKCGRGVNKVERA